MQALVFDGKLHFATLPIPKPNADQCLIKILRAGICNTDLELTRGYKGFSGVLGHEFVGVVVEGSPEFLGKRVVGEINVSDQTCDMCLKGVPSQCRHRTTVGLHKHQGAFAEYLALVSRNLYPVPDTVTDEEAVFVEPLAAACQILESVSVSPRDRIVVLGAGKLGILCAQVLALTGADVRVLIRRESQVALLQSLGLSTAYRHELADAQAQIVVDCTGTPEGFAEALALVEPRGTLVLKSTYEGLTTVNLSKIAVDEIRVVGSRCGPFDVALRLLAGRRVNVMPLIAQQFEFNDALDAFETAFQPGMLKVVLNF